MLTHYHKTRLILVLLAILPLFFTACSKEESKTPTPEPDPYAGYVVVSTDITTNTTWKASEKYILKNLVNVKAGATLTIEPGTIIKGDKATKGTLIIDRGAQIIAVGTPNKPIVFTSAQPKGSRKPGDWGGLILCGNAPINLAGGTGTIEGGSEVIFGGTNPNDNSGKLQYVRIEYAGVDFLKDNEVNGLTLGGVGRNTEISHIQVSFANDDSYEFFGGNVNAKYLVAYGGVDDDFDTDLGYSGIVQFGLAIRNPRNFDAAGTSNGYESDNNGQGTSAEPLTRPIFTNMTVVGPLGFTDTPSEKFGVAAHIRRNSRMSMYNSVMMDYNGGLLLDGDATVAAAKNNDLQIRNTVIAGCKTPINRKVTNETFDVSAWFNTPGWGNSIYPVSDSIGYTAPYATRPNFTIKAGSPLSSGADFSSINLQSDFVNKTVQFIGAMGNEDWTAGWTNFDPQNTDY